MPDQLDGPVRDFVSGLRHMHGELGLSLKDLESRLPASRSSLSRYLRGQSLPDERLLVQWCKLSFTGEDRLPELVRLLHLANEAAAAGGSDGAAGGSDRTEAPAGAAERRPKSSRRKWVLTAAGTVLVIGAAAAVVVGLTGGGSPNSPAGPGVSRETGPAAKNGRTERITVHNVEKACQHSHRRECALGLALDPYVPYRPSNIGGRVWHGDRLTAQCRIANGVTVTDEAGGHNSIWYKVRLHDKDLWFPGIRIEPDQLQYSTLRNCPD